MSVQRTPTKMSPPKAGSQPDLTKLKDVDSQYNVVQRKRKQPDYDSSIKEDLAKFRNEVLSILASFSTEQNKSMQVMQRELTASINDQVSAITSLSEKILEDYTLMKSDVNELKERMSSVEIKCTTMSSATENLPEAIETIKSLTTENNNIKQYALMNNIEISGIPFVKGENLTSILHKICSKVGYTLLDTDVDTIHRVRRFFSTQSDSQTKLRPPAIIVKFTQRMRKDGLLAAVRARRGLTTADIELPGPAMNLFLSDHLTPNNKLLLKLTREFKKEHNYAYVWTRDCKIFLRKNEHCKTVLITDASVLKRLN